ncbi:flagellar assembly protein FliH [Pluralibacter gergoviae]
MSDSDAWQRWQPEDLFSPAPASAPVTDSSVLPAPEAPSADVPDAALALVRQQAHEQGYSAGLAEGRSAGHSEGYQQGLAEGAAQGVAQAQREQALVHQQMQQLVADFQQSLDALDSVIVSRLMQTALAAARQVLGHALPVDSGALIAQIQQQLLQEPLFSGRPQLRVHPDDVEIVQQMAGPALAQHGWQLRGDPTLHRGGCTVIADDGSLDASLGARWQAICRLAAPDGRP